MDSFTYISKLLDQDTPNMEQQWNEVKRVISESEPEKNEILQWIFREYKGFTYYRSRAGVHYVSTYPDDGWAILHEMINSEDPDNRDTAISVISEIRDSRGDSLALKLLSDDYPYLQFAAVEILMKTHRNEVLNVLHELTTHKEQWVREKAYQLLLEIKSLGES